MNLRRWIDRRKAETRRKLDKTNEGPPESPFYYPRCPDCEGTGTREDDCRTCSGFGVVPRWREQA